MLLRYWNLLFVMNFDTFFCPSYNISDIQHGFCCGQSYLMESFYDWIAALDQGMQLISCIWITK